MFPLTWMGIKSSQMLIILLVASRHARNSRGQKIEAQTLQGSAQKDHWPEWINNFKMFVSFELIIHSTERIRYIIRIRGNLVNVLSLLLSSLRQPRIPRSRLHLRRELMKRWHNTAYSINFFFLLKMSICRTNGCANLDFNGGWTVERRRWWI